MGDAVATGIATFKEWFEHLDGKKNGWKHGLCTDFCSDPKLACYSCCCGCLLAASLTADQGGNILISLLCNCCCPVCANFSHRQPERSKTRASGGVKDENIMSDMAAIGCKQCALAQEAKQKNLGGGPAGLPAFTVPKQSDMNSA
jgi:Cys-rich protein (TIGR01571 family)